MAAFTYPTNGATGVNYSQPFTWSAATGAQGYEIDTGTTPGAYDVAKSATITGTSWTPSQLRAGSSLWARLWTYTSQGWRVDQDITFTTAANLGMAAFTYPTNGATGVNYSQPFT